VDVAIGQIPRSTERISSYELFPGFGLYFHNALGLFPFHRMSVPVYLFIHSNIKLYNKVNQQTTKMTLRFCKKY